MAGRGPQSFQKRQKEQQRKERQDEKKARKVQRKLNPELPETDEELMRRLEAAALNPDGDDNLDADPADSPVEHFQNS